MSCQGLPDNSTKKRVVENKSTETSDHFTGPKEKPCWLNRPIEECSDYKALSEEWLLLYDSLITDKKTETLPDSTINTLQNLLANELIQQMSITVISEIEASDDCKNNNCQTIMHSFIQTKSKEIMNPDTIIIIDHYWQYNDNNQWVLWGLGKYSKNFYKQKLALLRTQNLKNTVPKKEQSVSFEKFTQSPPKSDIKNNYFNRINHVKLPKEIVYQSLPEQLSTEQIITIIQNDFVNKRKSRNKDNIYPNHDVLDTDCIKTEFSIPFESAELLIKKEFSANKKNWQSSSRKLDYDYVNKIRNILEQINATKKKLNDLQELINSWEYTIKKNKLLKQMYDTRKRYYDIQKTLINRYCLTFTIAFSNIREKNIRFMLNQSDALARMAIIDDGLLKQIESNINIVDQYLISTLRTTYRAKITMDYFGSIIFKPDHFRGKLRKFKIDLIEQKSKPAGGLKKDIVESDIAKSYIIVSSNENMIINNNTCTNIADIQDLCFQKFLDALNQYSYISIKNNEKNKTQYLINEVINDNCQAQIQTRLNQLNKEKELNAIKHQIYLEEKKIREINQTLVSKHEIQNNMPKQYIDNIAPSLRKKYEEIYNARISALRKEYAQISSIQPVVAHVLVEGPTDYNKIYANIKSQIKEKIEDSIHTFCPEVNWGEQLFHDRVVQTNEHLSTPSIPKIKAYDIPQITILPVQDTDYAECTVPIFFKIDCISNSKSFVYHKDINAIEDTDTKYFWEICEPTQISKRKNINEQIFQYPDLSDDQNLQQFFLDYQEFCHSYADYRNSWAHVESLPEIKCVNRFEMVDNSSFKDNLRFDHWKIIDKSTYFDLIMKIKDSEWRLNSFHSLQRLFSELKTSTKDSDYEFKIIQLLSNKSFWSNTTIDYNRKSIAVFDFSQNDLIENARATDEMLFGIVRKKF